MHVYVGCIDQITWHTGNMLYMSHLLIIFSHDNGRFFYEVSFNIY